MRGKRAKRKTQKVDRKYGSPIIGRFVTKVMQDGKKSVAEDLVYSAVENGANTVKEKDIVTFVNKAVDNVRPSLEIKARRVGGANYSIPMPVSPARQESLAIRWVVDAARMKSGDSFTNILRKEMIDVYNGQGAAYEKKLNVERMAEANKAFAHFKW